MNEKKAPQEKDQVLVMAERILAIMREGKSRDEAVDAHMMAYLLFRNFRSKSDDRFANPS
jgi:hypothetical protein